MNTNRRRRSAASAAPPATPPAGDVDSPKRRRHADSIVNEYRIKVIVHLRLGGARSWDIFQFIAEKERIGEQPWAKEAHHDPLSERRIRALIALADARIADIILQEEKDAIHLHFAQRRYLYARCVEAGDNRTALAVLQDLATLADLYPSKKVKTELTGKDGGKIETETTVIDVRAKILDYAEDFRAAAERNLQEADELAAETSPEQPD